ncbi:MAG TPA: HemK/PrmC family methyltransferase [Burkholderiales bacterium]|jgi:release factor glutamine methyltransferase
MQSLFQALLDELRGQFEPQHDKPDETPESVLRALWFHAAGTPMSIRRINGSPLPPIGERSVELLRTLVERKREGVPLAHLTGRQDFMGLELLAGPAALIPRRETEILGIAALGHLRRATDESLLATDVCTGSGNLALALAHHEPRATVYAADLSSEAVALAQRNAAFTGLAGRVEFRAGDLFAPLEGIGLEGRCHLVTCNPPYVPSGKVPRMAREISAYEPPLAFDGGALGLAIVWRLLAEAPRFLKSGGALCFELGLGQGALESRVRRAPWVERVETHRDATGEIRALTAIRR